MSMEDKSYIRIGDIDIPLQAEDVKLGIDPDLTPPGTLLGHPIVREPSYVYPGENGAPVCRCGGYNFPHRPGGGKCLLSKNKSRIAHGELVPRLPSLIIGD